MREPALLCMKALVRGSATQRSERKKVFEIKLFFNLLNNLVRIRGEWLRDFELVITETKAMGH